MIGTSFGGARIDRPASGFTSVRREDCTSFSPGAVLVVVETVPKSFMVAADVVAVADSEAGFEKLGIGAAKTDDDPEEVAVDGPGLPVDRIYAAAIAS